MKKAFFQSFEDSSDRDAGPDRLLLLQAELKKKKLLGYLVPRTDVYQGEYVAKCDERLSWLTGFTGSAGICVVCLLYTSPSPRDRQKSRMPSSA